MRKIIHQTTKLNNAAVFGNGGPSSDWQNVKEQIAALHETVETLYAIAKRETSA